MKASARVKQESGYSSDFIGTNSIIQEAHKVSLMLNVCCMAFFLEEKKWQMAIVALAQAWPKHITKSYLFHGIHADKNYYNQSARHEQIKCKTIRQLCTISDNRLTLTFLC